MKTYTKIVLAAAALGSVYWIFKKTEEPEGPPKAGKLVFSFKANMTAGQVESAAKSPMLIKAINACGPIQITSYSTSGKAGDNVIIVYSAMFPATFPDGGDRLSPTGTACMLAALKSVAAFASANVTGFAALGEFRQAVK